MRVWDGRDDLLTLLRRDEAVTARIPAEDLAALFDHSDHMRHVDTIFERVFAPHRSPSR